MNASELIATIRGMTSEEKAEFGRALAECGVSVVVTRKLGSARQSVPPIKSVKDYEGTKKGSPLEE